jgi:hypothetical protein
LRLLGGGQVTLVQQQVDDRQDLVEPRLELVGIRDAVGDTRLGDLALGPSRKLAKR